MNFIDFKHYKRNLPAIYFLRPETILHAYDCWQTNCSEVIVSREFGLMNINARSPFVMVGVDQILDFVKEWKITAEDIAFLKRIKSLKEIPKEFWQYLNSLQFAGKISGIPTSEIVVIEHIEDESSTRHLIKVQSSIVLIELVSEAIATVLSFCIAHSANVQCAVNSKIHTFGLGFGNSDTENHPYWGLMASHIECLVGAAHPLGSYYTDDLVPPLKHFITENIWIFLCAPTDEVEKQKLTQYILENSPMKHSFKVNFMFKVVHDPNKKMMYY